MLKKVFLGFLLTGFIGILIWGGVNRTLAKTNKNAGRSSYAQNVGQDMFTDGDGRQQRGTRIEKYFEDEYTEKGFHGYANVEAIRGDQLASSNKAEYFTGINDLGKSNRGGRGTGNGR